MVEVITRDRLTIEHFAEPEAKREFSHISAWYDHDRGGCRIHFAAPGCVEAIIERARWDDPFWDRDDITIHESPDGTGPEQWGHFWCTNG